MIQPAHSDITIGRKSRNPLIAILAFIVLVVLASFLFGIIPLRNLPSGSIYGSSLIFAVIIALAAAMTPFPRKERS